MTGAKTILSAILSAAILAVAGLAAAIPVPDLPLTAAPRLCANFEEGTLAHDCCLQFPSDDIARRCCTVGFDPQETESFECCRENAANNIHPGTPEEPTACEVPDEERPPEEIPPEEIPEEPAPSEDPTPGETPPGGSELAPGQCLVTPLDAEVVKGTLVGLNEKGMGIALRVEYLLPAGVASAFTVTLGQTSGPEVAWTGSAALSAGASSRFEWTVQMGRPGKMIGEFIPNAAFLVVVADAQGKTLHQATCSESAGIHSQGGSGGCSLLR
jgi:hypothetical protein